MSRTLGANNYTDEEIVDSLRDHMVNKLLSKYAMSKPTWRAIAKRMVKDDVFEDKVHTIEAEALAKWEKVGLKALMTNDAGFNTQLFKMYVGSKKSFIDHTSIELEERIAGLENAKSFK